MRALRQTTAGCEVEGVEPSNILTELYESCALIFDEVGADGITPMDYHDTINGEKFIGWMQNRLFPTFAKKYPGKKMYLVLDNAKYHHLRGPEWVSPSKMKRGQLAEFLRQRQIKSITVTEHDKSTRVVPHTKFSADWRRDRTGGPNVEQLQKAVKQHLEENPEINQTVPQQLMKDKHYELIYTPPYVSQLQPIELIWAYTKALVARQSRRDRTVQECAVQTRVAMDEVSAELCQAVIERAEKWMDAFMKTDAAGSLAQFTDLARLKSYPPEYHKAAANDTAYTRPIIEEQEEDEQNAWRA